MKTFEITEEQIKQAYDAACEDWKQRIKEWFPEWNKKQSGWYKNKKCLAFIEEVTDDGEDFIGYGFVDDKWIKRTGDWTCELNKWVKAPEKEVEERLIEEAKRRGYNIGVKCIFGDAKQIRAITNSELKYARNNLYMGNDLIFRCDIGEWAKIISTPQPDEYITVNNIKYKRCN